MTCECYPLAQPGTRVRIFGRERWEIFELRKRLGVVATDLPSERTLHTKGSDAVITGFFSSSTIWPELHVTPAMRERAAAILERARGAAPGGKAARGNVRRRAAPHPDRASAGSQSRDAADRRAEQCLDLAAQAELQRTLRVLAQHGTGIFLITHHLADIPPEIERIVMMRDGRIVADGPKNELLTEERLENLFGVRVTMARRDGHFHVW